MYERAGDTDNRPRSRPYQGAVRARLTSTHDGFPNVHDDDAAADDDDDNDASDDAAAAADDDDDDDANDAAAADDDDDDDVDWQW